MPRIAFAGEINLELPGTALTRMRMERPGFAGKRAGEYVAGGMPVNAPRVTGDSICLLNKRSKEHYFSLKIDSGFAMKPNAATIPNLPAGNKLKLLQ
ncbi:MAG: hypothetical protein AB7H77_03930 [Bdellovibrionales bacterium]